MTNINFKKSETMTSFIAALVFALVLLSPTTILPNIHAQIANYTIIPAKVGLDIIKKNTPTKLSVTQLENVKRLVLSDARVQAIVKDDQYEFMSQSFLGNIRQMPVVWNPVININVNYETDVAVEVNLNNNSVINVEKTALHKGSTQVPADPAFAEDYYTGSATISGVYASLTAPTYTSNPDVLWLVNGIEYGANDSPTYACNSSYEFNDYFGQGGFDFYDGYVAYADTSTNCVMQNSMIGYTASHPYLFEVYSSTGPYWNIVDLDQQSGLSNLYTTSFTTYASTLKTSDYNTSVWFENQETSTTWASDFSTSIKATDANYYSSGWNYWGSDSQAVQDCSGNSQTQNVMNKDLINDDTQTWDLSNFEGYHC